MLQKLLEKGLVKLVESKGPKKGETNNDPKYCKCHRIISHPIEKCNVSKRQVLQLAKERRTMLDEEGAEDSD